MTRGALTLLLCLAACKAHFEEEARTHASVAEQVDAAQRVDTHVEQAPGRVTTTVEEFAPGLDGRGDSPGPVTAGLARPPNPTLVKRTVTVAETGAVVTDTHLDAKSQDRKDSELDDQHQTEQSFDFLSNPLTWLGAGVLVAAAIGVALKLRKAVPV